VRSIKSRLLLASLIVLAVFMLLTAFALERAVEKRMLQAEEDKLGALMYSILAAVDRDATGLSITVSDARLFEHGLFDPQSSLRALLYSEQGEIWRSISTVNSYPHPGQLDDEELRFSQLQHDDERWFQLAFSIRWPNVHARLDGYHLVLWKNARDYYEQLRRFRQTLWSWLVVTISLLLLVMWLVMLWGLRPLRCIGDEVTAIENGEKESFDASYPAEIKPLTQNLNRLLQRERHQMQRYRHALDDLAHSLKTPLAVLRGLSEKGQWQEDDLKTLVEQNERMNQIVSYQLKKAATVGGDVLARPVNLSALARKTVGALSKVYQGRGIGIEMHADDDVQLRMDESDLMEILGNLLDNACKYGSSRVEVRVLAREGRVEMRIEDDGDGLSTSQIERIVTRGMRFDQSREGQGIGLAVVKDIVEAYEIGLDFGRSNNLGGLRVDVTFSNT
jgi:two-component system sensor histidine kinase PhoQ